MTSNDYQDLELAAANPLAMGPLGQETENLEVEREVRDKRSKGSNAPFRIERKMISVGMQSSKEASGVLEMKERVMS